MYRYLALALTVVIIASLGCSQPADNESATPQPETATAPATATETPEQVAERVMQAASTEDEEAFLAVLTQKARESMESDDDSGGFAGQEYDSYDIGTAVVDGAEATVPVEAVSMGEPESLNLKLRQESGAWRLYGLDVEIAPGTNMTVNFENIGEMMQEMMEGMGEALGEAFSSAMEGAFQMGSPEEAALKLAMFDAFETVSAEEYESSWKSAEDFRGTPRLEAITTLAEALALDVHAGSHADALSGPVETDVRGMSRLEAIERIANEAGLYSTLPNLQDWGIASDFMEGMAEMLGAVIGGEDSAISVSGDGAQKAIDDALNAATNTSEDGITFTPDPPAHTAQFLGPFRLDLVSIEENVPYATGSLILQVVAHGLPAPVLSALERQGESFRIDAVENADGEPLIDMDLSYLGGGSIVGSAYFDMATRELTGLLQSVDRIALIQGAIDVPLPAAVEEADFDALAPGASQRVDGLTITADQVDSYTSFKVAGPDESLQTLDVLAQAYGADGEPMTVHFSDFQAWREGEGVLSLNTDEKPARVRLKLVLASETESYPFEFSDVPLKHAAEQPVALAELDFGDHDAPLIMTFGGIVERDPSFSEVTVTVENVSNKEPESVFVDFVYFDADGNELDSFPHTINGAFTADGFEPLAKPGESVETEQTAFQMPENTETIGFRFNHVEFMDGSRWEPEQ
jgi:hypothetical protein